MTNEYGWATRLAAFTLSVLLLCGAAVPSDAASVQTAYKDGLERARAGDHASAIRSWRKLLRDAGGRLNLRQKVRVALRIARSYEALGKPEQSRKYYAYALKLDPANKRARRGLGKASTGGKGSADLDQAMAAVENGLLAESAAAGQGKSHFLEALPVLERALARDNGNSRVHYGLGVCLLYTKGADPEARKHLEKAAGTDEASADAWYHLSVFHQRKDDKSSQIQALEKSYGLGRKSASMAAELAAAYGRRNGKGDGEKALSYATKAIEEDSSYGQGIVDAVADATLSEKIRQAVARAAAEEAKRAKAAAAPPPRPPPEPQPPPPGDGKPEGKKPPPKRPYRPSTSGRTGATGKGGRKR